MNKEELEDLLSIGCCKYHEEIGEKAKKEIERLQHNQEVSTKWEIKLTQKNTKLIEENKRLKNIINELEKWHKKEIEEWEESKNKSVNSIAIGEHIISLNKIKELKGSDKE